MKRFSVRTLQAALLLAALSLATAWGGRLEADELPTAKPEDVGMSSEGLKKIADVMKGHIDAGRIQGGVVAVARKGKVVYFEPHGQMDVANNKPMTKDAIFRMASSTKPVTAVALLMMVEEGKVNVKDPVSKYIPEFKNSKVAVAKGGERPASEGTPEIEIVPANHDVTIEDLLTHTSGLLSSGIGSRAPGGQVQREAGATLATHIPKLGAVPLDFQPGTKWAYSGGAGPDVLGRVVEIVSGKPFDQFLKERIFDPLGMKDTHFNVPVDKQGRRVVISGGGRGAARGNTAGAAAGATGTDAARGTTYFSGAGGLSSTAEDYLRFEQMLINKGQLFGKRVIGEKMVETMSTNHVGDLYKGLGNNEQGMGFGYLVAVVQDSTKSSWTRMNGAFGWGGAFGTQSWTDPKAELTVAIMLQQRQGQVQRDVEKTVLQAVIK